MFPNFSGMNFRSMGALNNVMPSQSASNIYIFENLK